MKVPCSRPLVHHLQNWLYIFDSFLFQPFFLLYFLLFHVFLVGLIGTWTWLVIVHSCCIDAVAVIVDLFVLNPDAEPLYHSLCVLTCNTSFQCIPCNASKEKPTLTRIWTQDPLWIFLTKHLLYHLSYLSLLYLSKEAHEVGT